MIAGAGIRSRFMPNAKKRTEKRREQTQKEEAKRGPRAGVLDRMKKDLTSEPTRRGIESR